LAVDACDVELVNKIKSLRFSGRSRFPVLGFALLLTTFFTFLATLSSPSVFVFAV
jgi:hypothetical protein